ncbi:MAG: methyltransferase domain-containing protein [Candidatus Magasanikbacteria bacterium]|nr:methyltransferase domain-containing protein [Candidatus Magasanikbacteria bacterium]
MFDAGCGIGILSLALKLLGYNVEGGDKYLFVAGTPYFCPELPRLQTIWSQEKLSISSKDMLTDSVEQKYDCVISIATIEHQKDTEWFIQKIIQHISSGGYLYMATPNIAHLLNRVRFLFGRSPMTHNLRDFFSAGENYTGHWREYTLKELKSISEWSNLEIIMARNMQSARPFRRFKNFRELYVDFFRLLSYLIPGTKDTNLIFAKVKR